MGEPRLHRRRAGGVPHLGLRGSVHDTGDLRLEAAHNPPQIDEQ
ncbi:MAG: hypothetical protein ABI949_09265 [Ilumatobacteraceae bacterium]